MRSKNNKMRFLIKVQCTASKNFRRPDVGEIYRFFHIHEINMEIENSKVANEVLLWYAFKEVHGPQGNINPYLQDFRLSK
jgi:hypothetical protein